MTRRWANWFVQCPRVAPTVLSESPSSCQSFRGWRRSGCRFVSMCCSLRSAFGLPKPAEWETGVGESGRERPPAWPHSNLVARNVKGRGPGSGEADEATARRTSRRLENFGVVQATGTVRVNRPPFAPRRGHARGGSGPVREAPLPARAWCSEASEGLEPRRLVPPRG